MEAFVHIQVPLVVMLDDEDLARAMVDHARDVEGDVHQAATIVARERVHAMVTRAGEDSKGVDFHDAPDVLEVRVNNVCEACHENDAYNDDGPGGLNLCPRCVEDALAFIAIRDAIENGGREETYLDRAVDAMQRDDVRNLRATMPYVDSTSNAWDRMRSQSDDDVRDDIVRVMFPLIMRRP